MSMDVLLQIFFLMHLMDLMHFQLFIVYPHQQWLLCAHSTMVRLCGYVSDS